LLWIGALFGAAVASLIADNAGRRVALLAFQLLTILGCSIVLLASNMVVAEIGVFILGFGAHGFFSPVLCILE